MPKKEKIIENVNKTTFAIYYGITKSFLYQYEVATLINLGKFENAGRVKIVTPDGQVFVGKAGEATMKEDEEELELDEPSDWLTLWINGQPLSFRPEDILSIEKID